MSCDGWICGLHRDAGYRDLFYGVWVMLRSVHGWRLGGLFILYSLSAWAYFLC